MKGNPLWIDVTELMKLGVGTFFQPLMEDPAMKENLQTYLNRLSTIENIKSIELHIETVTGPDKTIDVVVGIFNRVNSGGTKLSKGDLALANICAGWPEARGVLKTSLQKWETAGFKFNLDWFLRCITAIVTGEAKFEYLTDVNLAEFKDGIRQAERAIDDLLNMIGSRLGLDHDRVLGSRYSFPLMVRYLFDRGFRLENQVERDRLLFWYIQSFLWGRYAGSTESKLAQDLNHIEDHENALSNLISQIRTERGDTSLHANDFFSWSRGSRFYPLLYMLTRIWGSKDWDSGVELRHDLLVLLRLQHPGHPHRQSESLERRKCCRWRAVPLRNLGDPPSHAQFGLGLYRLVGRLLRRCRLRTHHGFRQDRHRQLCSHTRCHAGADPYLTDGTNANAKFQQSADMLT